MKRLEIPTTARQCKQNVAKKQQQQQQLYTHIHTCGRAYAHENSRSVGKICARKQWAKTTDSNIGQCALSEPRTISIKSKINFALNRSFLAAFWHYFMFAAVAVGIVSIPNDEVKEKCDLQIKNQTINDNHKLGAHVWSELFCVGSKKKRRR